ncbi:MAG: aromatic ring-hydroxylating dioxygenase subunit alpha, partial [Ilumatobacteraceae bacterium]
MTGILCDSVALANSWHAVARSVEVVAAPVAVTVLGRDVVLWRTPSGTVFAAADRCPHRQAPLSIGTVHDGCLTCAYHGWTFGDEGHCVRVPSASEGVPPAPRAHLAPYECEEQYGLVWVCIGTPSSPIPCIAQEADPSFRRINTPVDVWRSSATRMVDNFLDISHFPFVHVGTFGRAQDTLVPRFELQPLDDGYFGYRYEVMADNTTGTLVSGQTQQVVHRSMSSGFSLPFVVRSTIHYDSGLEHILLLLSTPIDDVTSYFTFVVWRNDDFSV